jgi:hypothetical protein
MVRAGGGVRRSDRRVQFRRLPGRRCRRRAGRPESRSVAAPGGGRRGQRAILVRPHAGRGPRRGKERRGGTGLDHLRRERRNDRGAGHAGRHGAERRWRSKGPSRRSGPVHQGRRIRACRRHVRDRRDAWRRARRADGSGRGPDLVPRRRRTRPTIRANDAGAIPAARRCRRVQSRRGTVLAWSARPRKGSRTRRPISPRLPPAKSEAVSEEV